MDRRSVLLGAGVYAGDLIGRLYSSGMPIIRMPPELDSPGPMLDSVAGIKIVDSQIAKDATALSKSVSPAYLFNHAMRTYLYGSLVGRARGQHYDEEALFLACILHDLGLDGEVCGRSAI